MGDLPFAQYPHQIGVEGGWVARQKMERRARAEGHKEIGRTGIKVKGGGVGHAAARGDGKGADVRFNRVAQTAMFDQHAVRFAGGAGGIDHVDKILRPGRSHQVGARFSGKALFQQHNLCSVRRERCRQRGLADHKRRRRVLEQKGQPLLRISRVERHIGAAGLENA